MDACDSVIEKIKKAVRLANRTTEEGERNTAMRLANQLAEKNGIRIDDLDIGEEAVADAVVCADAKYRTLSGSELVFIYCILKEHFGVIVMERRIKGHSSKRAFTWFGPSVNIEIGKYVFQILHRESNKAYIKMRTDVYAKMYDAYTSVYDKIPKDKKALSVMNVRPMKRKDFMRGFFMAIDEKLTQCPIRNDIAMARKRAEAKLQEYRSNNGGIRDIEAKQSKSLDAKALSAGYGEGRKVNLSRPCEGNGARPLALCA